MSFSKTRYPLLSVGSTQETLSRHDWKFVDCDVKTQNKQNQLVESISNFKDCMGSKFQFNSNFKSAVSEHKVQTRIRRRLIWFSTVC